MTVNHLGHVGVGVVIAWLIVLVAMLLTSGCADRIDPKEAYWRLLPAAGMMNAQAPQRNLCATGAASGVVMMPC